MNRKEMTERFTGLRTLELCTFAFNFVPQAHRIIAAKVKTYELIDFITDIITINSKKFKRIAFNFRA